MYYQYVNNDISNTYDIESLNKLNPISIIQKKTNLISM